jgi:protein SCO1/2
MRSRLPGVPLVRRLAVLAVVPVLVGCGSSSDPAPPAPQVGTTLDRPVPADVASLPLHDASGHQVTLSSLEGKTVVISDSMTLCSEDCPLDTANVTAAARATDAAGLTGDVEFLTISVDPRRDDSRHLTAYRTLYDPHDALPNWALLTGTHAQLTRLWKFFGVYWHRVPGDEPAAHDWLTGRPLTYDIEHDDTVLVLDPHGHERFVIVGHAHVADRSAVPGRIRSFLSAAGRRHLDRPDAAAWTPGDVLQAVSWLTGRRVPLSGDQG